MQGESVEDELLTGKGVYRFRFIYSKIHIHQNLQLAQMERQARLLGKTYKQNLTILIDTEQTKNEPLFHQ